MAHITNARQSSKSRSFDSITKPSPANDAFHLGWADFREGRDFNPSYMAWSEGLQKNYENGRLAAAHLKGKFGLVPKPLTNSILLEAVGPRLNDSGFFEDHKLLSETNKKFIERAERQKEMRAMLAEVGVAFEVEVY